MAKTTATKTTKRGSGKAPTQVTIRAYQVGFGDCFLVTFHYAGKAGQQDRHILIDCGSTGSPKKPKVSLEKVAEQIKADCGGKLTAIIATHRHKDHIDGFATNEKGTASGDILRGLKPDLVMQPWTEDPQAAKNAKSIGKAMRAGTQPVDNRMFVAGLRGMHGFAAVVVDEVQRIGKHLSTSLREQLSFLGEDNLPNLAAVKNLMAMGKRGRAEYLAYGSKTSLEKLLPGVKVRVLGPPTVKQYPEVARQRSKDASEFWQIMGAAAGPLTTGSVNPFPRAESYSSGAIPPAARWLVPRIRAVHGAQRLSLVRALDDAMNNTSLILLFEAGGKRFLFPGDAQIENWNYALKDSPQAAQNRQLLAETDFYKVGHHGSRNATPKTLWELFEKRDKKKPGLTTVVSTMAGKHGSASAKTEVPRRTLVNALKEETRFLTTQELRKAGSLCQTVDFALQNGRKKRARES